MISNLPGVGLVNDAIPAGQPGGPPAIVPAGGTDGTAQGSVPAQNSDPTAAPPPADAQPGVSLDGSGNPI